MAKDTKPLTTTPANTTYLKSPEYRQAYNVWLVTYTLLEGARNAEEKANQNLSETILRLKAESL